MTNIPDERLVARYLATKDEKTLEEIVRRYLPPLYGFVRKFTGNEHDASDIVQETFVKVWKHLDTFDQSKVFKTWIFTIAKYTALDWLKRKKAIPFSALDGAHEGQSILEILADEMASPFEQLISREAVEEIRSARVQLSSAQNDVIALHLEKDLNFREISELVHQPLNTVKSTYRRGIEALKKTLSLSGE